MRQLTRQTLHFLLSAIFVSIFVVTSLPHPIAMAAAGENSPANLPAVLVPAQASGQLVTAEQVYQFLRPEQQGPANPNDTIKIRTVQDMRDYLAKRQAEAVAKKRNIFVQTAYEFVPEFATFTVAVGGLIALKLILDYAENPVAMEQHLASLKDPIAYFSFYNFMLANRAVGSALMTSMYARQLRPFIPYLGMTAGMIASNITHELFGDPLIKECARDLMGQPSLSSLDLSPQKSARRISPCDAALKAWMSSKKVKSWTPGILAMLGSTGILGTSSIAAKKAAEKAMTNATIKSIAVATTTVVTPGGVYFIGAKWLYKVAHIIGFLGIQETIQPYIEVPFRNYFDSQDLREANDKVASQLRNNAPFKPEFIDDLSNYTQLSKEWRDFNLQKPMMSYQAWQTSLMNLSSMYLAAKNFYLKFFGYLNAKLSSTDPKYVSILDRLAPFYGINPIRSQFPDNIWLEYPDEAEAFQVLTLQALMPKLEMLPTFIKSPSERKQFQTLVEDLKQNLNSGDANKIAYSLQSLTKLMTDAEMNIHTTFAFKTVLQGVAKALGEPQPKMEPGEYFTAAIERYPEIKPLHEGVSFPSGFGLFATDTLSNYFILSMICGPSIPRNDSVVEQITGFSATFKPPQIILPNTDIKDTCHTLGAKLPSNLIFRYPMGSYQGAMQLLSTAIDPAIVSKGQAAKGQKHGELWWTNNIESQIAKAYKDFSVKYNEIGIEFIDALNTPQHSKNRGPQFNSPLYSMVQEADMYFYVMNSISQRLMKKDIPWLETRNALQNLTSHFSMVDIKREKGFIEARYDSEKIKAAAQKARESLKKIGDMLGVADNTANEAKPGIGGGLAVGAGAGAVPGTAAPVAGTPAGAPRPVVLPVLPEQELQIASHCLMVIQSMIQEVETWLLVIKATKLPELGQEADKPRNNDCTQTANPLFSRLGTPVCR